MLPENRAFWVRGDDDQEYGPVDLEELREWVAENRAGLGTVVRLDEPGTSWQPWQHYPELVALLAEVHVTSQVPGQPGLVLASLGRRILASVVDLFLCSILAYVMLSVVMASVNMTDLEKQCVDFFLHPENTASPQLVYYISVSNVIMYSVMAFYMTGFHFLHGKTPGKTLLGLRVVDQNGQKPTFLKSLLRALTFVICLDFLIPLVYVFFNPQRRAFHDLVAGTYVVEA